jgi:hypothetical protein
VVFNNTKNQLTIALSDIESYDATGAEFTPEATQEVKHYTSDDTYTPYEGYVHYAGTSRVTELKDKKEVVFVFEKPEELPPWAADLLARQDIQSQLLMT